MKLFDVIDEALAKIEMVLLTLLLSLMLLVGFVQIILRNFFETGFLWADPFLRYTVLWLAFIGASLATREDRHINIDVLTRFLTPKLKKLTSILTRFFALAICVILLKASVNFIRMEIEFPQDVFLGIKNWQVEIIIPIGFSLMSFRFFVRILKLLLIKNIF
ncbi:TRAP transporter small permease [Candidatus Chrysopegis kryptomonas]|jgi:TRAP-type C4-dicarboxylate transport system permease small subunit|uniref:TRAP-type C4-dicarboxylate transport system, small permease component n=1 Tax=Candidatus Chryseopegocella kryptomonas TaxID=1633643 RepID=A0A0P1MUD7_9BACT|nr:TRAP transporter small permease [Candidatus Chrysopegis kryptomonas]CUS99576.1 TRAP-type C4-dicarboxylate transport system, small permease component [Candidatus Chrysopegis kryptomonas]